MNIQFCPNCSKDTEHDKGVCLSCSNKYDKNDLLIIIEQQQIVIDSLENQLQLAKYTVGTLAYPQYFTTKSIH